MVNTTGFEFGDIVLVRFPFTDQRGSKQRPAVVVSGTAYNQARPDVILMAVTSQIRRSPGFGEIGIDDWQTAGLLKVSVIKPVLFTMEQRLVVRILGQLKEKNQTMLRGNLRNLLG